MKKTTTPKQFEILVSYLQNHTDLAVGFANSSEAKIRRRQMWIRLTDRLNQHGPPVRNCVEWKSIWSDYKYNLKRKLAADLKLARRRNCNKRLPFNQTEQTVINLLGVRDKLGLHNFNKYGTRVIDPVPDPLANSLLQQPDISLNHVEINDNKEGIIVNNNVEPRAANLPTIGSVEPPLSTEQEYTETPASDVNISAILNSTLMSMQKTQHALLKELKESNQHRNRTHEVKQRLLMLEQEKLDEKKLQNYEENKQAYIKIELKRKELELYELKLKGLCKQCTMKKELD